MRLLAFAFTKGVKFPGVVAVLCDVSSGLVLHIGITSCTFPPWTKMSKKNGYAMLYNHLRVDGALDHNCKSYLYFFKRRS